MSEFLVIIAIILLFYGVSTKPDRHELITQCEKQLPRDQHCKLVAVPDGDK